jgi:hypothetical protein
MKKSFMTLKPRKSVEFDLFENVSKEFLISKVKQLRCKPLRTFGKILIVVNETKIMLQWKGSNQKQSASWQHVSRLKASAFCIW